MGILFLEATAQIKKSMCPPWIPFFLHSLENSAAKTWSASVIGRFAAHCARHRKVEEHADRHAVAAESRGDVGNGFLAGCGADNRVADPLRHDGDNFQHDWLVVHYQKGAAAAMHLFQGMAGRRVGDSDY